MYKMSKKSQYALIIFASLAKAKGPMSIKDIIGKDKLPIRFFARIAATLAGRGLLRSKEGRTGGYTLSREFKFSTLHTLLDIFENKKQKGSIINQRINSIMFDMTQGIGLPQLLGIPSNYE